MRRVALGVSAAADRGHRTTVHHLDGRVAEITPRPGATVTVSVEGNAATGFSVLAFALDGAIAADSWFETLTEAESYLAAQFGVAKTSWVDVPADVLDLHTFAAKTFQVDGAEA